MAINIQAENKQKIWCVGSLLLMTVLICQYASGQQKNGRQKLSINNGWKFFKYDSNTKPDSLIYDVRPDVRGNSDDRAADAKPTEAEKVNTNWPVLKPWIMPTGNEFIKDVQKHYKRPAADPGSKFPFVQAGYDDSKWENVTLPHDWAIGGPFYKEQDAVIGGGMGRLPVQGVAWYRRKLEIAASDAGKCIFLDLDGAMSYAMVWVNGKLAGGWPYGYSSWRLNITPYIKPGKVNQLAIRLDNPANSSRWYPGAGIYRNVWITKTNALHVVHWGTMLNCSNISKTSATVNLTTIVENSSAASTRYVLSTAIYQKDSKDKLSMDPVAKMQAVNKRSKPHHNDTVSVSALVANPRLWQPLPHVNTVQYVAVTTITVNGRAIDRFETPFGIRDIKFDPDKGIIVNGEHVDIKGVNQHHDLGALGAAFNLRAAERQLETLKEMGCNAIRFAHNPPSPELLELTDRMGFLVIDEIFDAWERKKTPLDFHLIFPDWSEQDLRAMIHRDRNHPSVLMWSIGNEVGEQYTSEQGAAVAKRLYAMAREEDPHRPLMAAMNYAKPDMPFPSVFDVISLNYQGEGIRVGPGYAGLKGISTAPLFPAFHQKFPGKVIISSENASAFSSRGEYFFPVFAGISASVKNGQGGDEKSRQVSSYELYSADFGSSADKVFATMAQHPFVAGGFVWSGWDYLGEPTPYYSSRSSYCGIIDLAGFKKDRFYLYQSQWRPQLPIAHILPHWNWPQRMGMITPVHVFTSGDEAELFLNGQSMGRKKKEPFEYRLRWDSIKYTPGELKVVAYKNGKKWAEETISTTGTSDNICLATDRTAIANNGQDLSFVTVSIKDTPGQTVPDAKNELHFSIVGPGEIVATDNGDATDLTPFVSPVRHAFNGYCLVIIRAKRGQKGIITLHAVSTGLKAGNIHISAH